MSQQQVTAYFVRALTVLVLLVGFFLTYRSMLRMSADSLYYLNLAAQFGLIIMGVFLALRDAWVKRHPNLVLIAFALVGAVAMFAAFFGRDKKTPRRPTKQKGELTKRRNKRLNLTLSLPPAWTDLELRQARFSEFKD
jgi:CDP-diglyceride synthetase